MNKHNNIEQIRFLFLFIFIYFLSFLHTFFSSSKQQENFKTQLKLILKKIIFLFNKTKFQLKLYLKFLKSNSN